MASKPDQEHEDKHKGAEEESNRGRQASSPHHIPPKGWRDVALRVKDQIGKDNLNIVAAGVAFYAFLAVFPMIIAAISIYALVTDPITVKEQFNALTTVLPGQAEDLIGNTIADIAGKASGVLGWSVAVSILFAIWSANKGMKALFQGLNIAYREEETRGLIKQNLVTLLFTFGGIVVLILSAALVVALPAILEALILPEGLKMLLGVVRWVILALVALLSLLVVYRFAPCRSDPKWRWVHWGAIIATALWLAGSWAFSFYVSNFGNFNKTYGTVTGVIILMLWFLLSSFIILLGAEIDAESEGQTKKDSTIGPEEPMGSRGAYYADNLRESP